MKKLTAAEEEVMQLFWITGPSTISALIDKMKDPKPPHSTISSIARILESKGYLGHKSYGRTYEYYPMIEKRSYQKFSLSKLAEGFFNNSTEELLSFIVKEEKVDMEKLRALLDQLENKSS
jgi:predicted transcriptional regulator